MVQAKGYAAQTGDTDLAPWDFERREIGPHDVLINILYCGVCHSDLHSVKNDWFPGIFPMVPGHEIVGRVLNILSHLTNCLKIKPHCPRRNSDSRFIDRILTIY